VLLPAANAPEGGLVLAAAPGIADELLAVLTRFDALEPIPD
ncbi:inositol monophosphatase, partial [Mycobacterium kansasii]